ncbi:uncharacterized protein TrAtP1_001954 [Trichoderma atroviride]|uniref:RRM domain-containing protein n=1 Tax=Hypocrea atroviridis (strain ATCC 20476 / IMI 206040) TaxID=452589 RepID=G9P3E4_HYPAI|nr:uncharacterized protein TRIATDRAFT_285595 [Trichoderma atroviride IMI 206040]EHK42903.1 hypothetical protein TRIATDRAFT_285595 [Trichoderma atroviride IMI 206040]UKZ60684.1 hypothetical protein TrAtP1_001954 [Trichoderma atroviride]
MKSKRATAASTEDSNPVDVSLDKKRKRTDDDAASSSSLKKHKEDIKEKREKKKEKKEKKREAKEDREAKKPKKDKSKYNNKTRKEKKDERKNIQDLPEDMDTDESSEGGAQNAEPVVTQPEAKTNGDAKEGKKDKKDKKEKKEKKKAEKAQSQPEASASKDAPQGGDAIDLDASTATKPGRNIVFVGNLPYTATAATITAHFASLKPVAVRCLTKKEDPKMCRGIAFVEFASPAHQRTCLDKFHHSMFEDGVSEPRRINVELTAGGGGKSEGRQGKIMEKNKKLDENRAKRIEKEKVAKVENQGNGGNARMDIHPSRLARLSGFEN